MKDSIVSIYFMISNTIVGDVSAKTIFEQECHVVI